MGTGESPDFNGKRKITNRKSSFYSNASGLPNKTDGIRTERIERPKGREVRPKRVDTISPDEPDKKEEKDVNKGRRDRGGKVEAKTPRKRESEDN